MKKRNQLIRVINQLISDVYTPTDLKRDILILVFEIILDIVSEKDKKILALKAEVDKLKNEQLFEDINKK